MKVLTTILTLAGVIVALTMVVSMFFAVAAQSDRRDACKAEGGAWVNVPLPTDHMPGGFPLYVCKTP